MILLLGIGEIFSHLVSVNGTLDTFNGIEKIADRSIVVERIDDICDVFAHITAYIPGAGQKFGRLVDKICGKYLGNNAVIVGFVKSVESACEKSEGSTYENLGSIAGLKVVGYFEYAFPSTLEPKNS